MSGFEEGVLWVIGAILVLSALLTLVRIVRGPSVLDRVVASDVLVSIIVCVLAVEAAATDHSTTLPILISLSLVGFTGSVAVARFVARDRDVPMGPGQPPAGVDASGQVDMPGQAASGAAGPAGAAGPSGAAGAPGRGRSDEPGEDVRRGGAS